jgi:hypothetical protein
LEHLCHAAPSCPTPRLPVPHVSGVARALRNLFSAFAL